MLYVIPFILLLVIAIVLKKRDDANKDKSDDKSKKTSAKKISKTPNKRSGRATSQPNIPSIPEAESADQTSSSVLDSELKTSIESLIAARDYSSAEAKINQALNQDNTHHQLYLYLVDIHVAQRDEFAIKQVINYLRSLGLHEIADQADQKYKAATASNKTADHTAPSHSFESLAPSADSGVKSNAAFDALIESKNAKASGSLATFDLLQNDLAEPEVDDGLKAIDYVVDTPTAPTEAESGPELAFNELPKTTTQALDFSFTEVKPTTLVADVEFEAPVIAPSPTEPTQPDEAGQNVPLEFSFEPKVEPAPTSNFGDEDFIFKHDFNSTTPTDAENETKNDFDLFQAPIEPTTPQHAELEFKLDPPVVEQPLALDFESPIADTHALQPQINEAASADHDPLAQSFPALLSVNEMTLNLQLAERYIELGAYDSAKLLLSEQQQQFSAEQRQLSEKLLNRIAS